MTRFAQPTSRRPRTPLPGVVPTFVAVAAVWSTVAGTPSGEERTAALLTGMVSAVTATAAVLLLIQRRWFVGLAGVAAAAVALRASLSTVLLATGTAALMSAFSALLDP